MSGSATSAALRWASAGGAAYRSHGHGRPECVPRTAVRDAWVGLVSILVRADEPDHSPGFAGAAATLAQGLERWQPADAQVDD